MERGMNDKGKQYIEKGRRAIKDTQRGMIQKFIAK